MKRSFLWKAGACAIAIAALAAVAIGASAGGRDDHHPAAAAAPQHATRGQQRAPARLTPRQRARAQAVAWARSQRGMHEVGTTNCSPAIDRWERHMGLAVPAAPPCRPWCGAFVHEAFYQARIDLSQRLIDPNESYWDALQHRNGLRQIPKTHVVAGDIVFFELDPGVQASHEEIVLGRPRDGKVMTAGGNVGHHAVVTRRGLRYVVLAARVTRDPTVR
jgi:hypothetical protein